MKRLYILWMGILLILAATHTHAQVVFNATNFPDANFRKHLKERYPGIFTADNITITDANLKRVRFLGLMTGETETNPDTGEDVEVSQLTLLNVSSLKGIEHFPELAYLRCDGNPNLKVLDLSNNPKLQHLHCRSTGLTSLDLRKNTEMQILRTNGCPLTSLNVTGCTKMLSIYVKECQSLPVVTGLSTCTSLQDFMGRDAALTALDLRNCKQLQVVNVGRNHVLKSLLLPATSMLTTVQAQTNALTSLDVTNCPNLEWLYIHSNQLTALNLSKNTKLKTLVAYNNKITGAMDLRPNTLLELVGVSNNQLTSLNVSGCTKLTQFGCNRNQLTVLDVTKNTALTELSCYNNHLRTLDLSKNATLTTLNCANQTSTEDVSVFDHSKVGIYLPSGGKKANFLNMQVAGTARTADVLVNSGRQYLVVNPAQTGDVDLYGKAVTYSYNTECPSTAITNKNMTGVTVTTYPYVMWVNPNSKSVSGNYYSGTIVLDYDAVVPAGTEVYVITGLKATPKDMMYDGTKYSMQQFNMQRIATAGQVVPKNTPVYVKSDTQDGLFAFGRNTANATPVAVPSGNLLKGSATAAITGFEPYSILTLGREQKTREVGFWQYSGTSSAKNRCYLEASILEGTNGAKGAVFSFDDEENQVTSIDETSLKANDQRFNDSWYTLDGRKIVNGTLPKGIYIHNGRKEVVR